MCTVVEAKGMIGRLLRKLGGELITLPPYIIVAGHNKASKNGAIIRGQTYVDQQKATGKVKWFIKYACSERFRVEKRVEAHGEEVFFREANGKEVDLAKVAEGVIEGWIFRNDKETSVDEVERRLNAWKEKGIHTRKDIGVTPSHR